MKHFGIGLIIRNETADKFFIQKKDENYPISKWKCSFSFWGGKIENSDKSDKEALIREISEELEPSSFIIKRNWNYINSYEVKSDQNYNFTLYELVLNNKEFNELVNLKVNEGFGEVQDKVYLRNAKWIWGLEKVFHDYISS